MIAVVLAELSDGGLDTRVLAVLGVLSAVIAILRGLSAGTGGVELVFFLLVLAGRVFGPGFGFVLGVTSLFASALLTAGVGPWLPFQMLVSAWVGMGAGLLPRRVTGRWEIAMLAVYGVFAAYAYGLLMNLSGWPFLLGIVVPGHEQTALSFDPQAPLTENLSRFAAYTLITSTGSFDTGRAITNAVAIVVVGPAVLTTLRRAARRATVVGHAARSARGSGRSRPGVSQIAGSRYPGTCQRSSVGLTMRIRSSSSEGEPRPSWLLVVTQRLPSGAVTTVRIRPYSPTKYASGWPAVWSATGIFQSRLPRRAAIQRASVGVGQPGGGRDVGAPRGLRVGVALRGAAGAFVDRPAVVGAGVDPVQLVERALAELRGPQLARRRTPAPARCGGRTTRPRCRTGCRARACPRG